MESKEKTAGTIDVVRTGIVSANSVSIIYFWMETNYVGANNVNCSCGLFLAFHGARSSGWLRNWKLIFSF